MADKCNKTGDTTGFGNFLGTTELWILLAVISLVLVLLLCWNIICCVAKCCSGNWTIPLPRIKRNVSLREMEENPIYGNIVYTQARVDPLDSPHSSSSPRDQQSVQCDSQPQSKSQDCYANLTLKAPRPQSGRSSPKIQYADVVQLQEPPEKDKETAANSDTVSTISDLYASVQTQRTKTLDTANGGDGYANHI